jgi:aryl-alcohol dehydrogenase-like predicted oxidoreductase
MREEDGACFSFLISVLTTLNRIAQKFNVSVANVATRYILDKTAVADVIVGARRQIIII